MQFDEVLTHFQIQKRYGDKAQARCPCHDDKQASLTITKGRRSALLHCHAGCNFEDIIVFWRAIFPIFIVMIP